MSRRIYGGGLAACLVVAVIIAGCKGDAERRVEKPHTSHAASSGTKGTPAPVKKATSPVKKTKAVVKNMKPAVEKSKPVMKKTRPAAEEGSPPVGFAKEAYEFEVDRDYEQHRPVLVRNDDDTPHVITARVDNRYDDMTVGFAGNGSAEQAVRLEPGEARTLDLVVFAQDARGEAYTFPVHLITDGKASTAKAVSAVNVRVRPVRFDLDVKTGTVDPVTLATTIKVTNAGDALGDLQVDVRDGLEGKVAFRPQLLHVHLDPGEGTRFDVVPLLRPGIRRMKGTLVLRAAGREKTMPLAFRVPEGKSVFYGISHSVWRTTGSTWFCTNRPKVSYNLDLAGEGPVPPKEAPPGTPPPSNPWTYLPRLLEEFVQRTPETHMEAIGVRGGTVRPPVAALRADLERDNASEPCMIRLESGGAAAVWHSDRTGAQQIYFMKYPGAPRRELRPITRSSGFSRWPCLVEGEGSVLYLVWEEEGSNHRPRVAFMSSSDGGSNWSDVHFLSPPGPGAFDPVMHIQSRELFVAWEDGRGGIYGRRSLNGGETWSDEIRVAKGPFTRPCLSGDGDTLWMVWMGKEEKGSAVYCARSRNGGLDWSASVKVSGAEDAAGEPTLCAAGGRVAVAWRDSRHGKSEIYFRVSTDGRKWQKEVRVTKDDAYNEYPVLAGTKKGYRLLFFSPAAGVIGRWWTRSSDEGRTWTAPVREFIVEPNVERCFFVDNFSLPWERSVYRRHDVHIHVNGQPVADLLDTIPEGRYLFPLDPRILHYRPGGTAENRIDFDTVHLNGSHYVVNSDFAVLQVMRFRQLPVVAASQKEADALAAASSGPEVNHDLPDVAVYANKVEGLPEDRRVAGKITLRVEVMNVGAAPAEGVELSLFKGEKGHEDVLAGPVSIPRIEPCSGVKVTLPFDYDGSVYRAALRARHEGRDFEKANDSYTFRMGYAPRGYVRFDANRPLSGTVYDQVSGEKVEDFSGQEEISLPIGIYRIVVNTGKSIVRNNVAVRGGARTTVLVDGLGTLRVRAIEDFRCRIAGDGKGSAVVAGTCNEDLAMAPGFYKVIVDAGEAGRAEVPDVLVRAGEETCVAAGNLGKIHVGAATDWPLVLLDPVTGAVVRKGSTNQDLVVAAGVYDLEVRPEGLPPTVKHGIRVPLADENRFDLSGYGFLSVEAIEPWRFRVFDGAKEVGDQECNMKLVLPCGSYEVKVRPNPFPEVDLGTVRILGGKVTKKVLGGFGRLQVEAIEPWRFHVFDGAKEVGDQECNMKLVLPCGSYEVKVRPDPFPEVDLGTVRILEGKDTKKVLGGFGRLRVKAGRPWRFHVFDGAKEIGDQECNMDLVLPVGTYSVRIEKKTMNAVHVSEGKTTVIEWKR